MNLEDDEVTNKSNNEPFARILDSKVGRRKVMAGGLAAMATTFVAPSAAGAVVGSPATPAAPEAGGGQALGSHRFRRPSRLIRFDPVPVEEGSGPVPYVSDDYEYQIIIPWGEPIIAPYPEHVNGQKSAEDQEKQIGIGHDGMSFYSIGGRNNRGLLCINHEFGTNPHVLGKEDPESLEDVRLSQAAHGMSVVELRSRGGDWEVVRGDYNRRITPNTPVEFSGPAAGHPTLGDASRPTLGTVNNCSSGPTPWGTYVTCEENFNGYFGATGAWTPSESQERYGFSENGFGYGWQNFDPRWDLSDSSTEGEENRFGWCVEVDPFNPDQPPVKRTALGRFKHEGVAFTTGRGGRVVGYMGDDQRFDYIYRYISEDPWRQARRRGESPLDHGYLYVAKFNPDGTGEWLPLTIDNSALAARFSSQAEILIDTRLAADILGATPMDRPEWTTVARNGDVYCACTNNSQREEAGPGSPLAPNADGHIIRWRDANNHTGDTFEWDIFIIATATHGSDDVFSDPDGLWADPDGRLFIQTDGGQKNDLNNQMLVADTDTGELRRILTGVSEDEITGIAYTPNRRTMFVNSQHPGDGDPSITNFPVMNPTPDGVTIPRDATFVLTRKNNGIVGS